jgi:hypothetical protein
MLERLPQVFRLILQYPARHGLREGQLHRHVRRLSASFYENIGLDLPPLDPLPLMVQCASELGLPGEYMYRPMRRRMPG